MDFTSLTVQILKVLADAAGSWGLAIIILTVVVRLAMWPLSLSQQRSMRKMQKLAPRLKEIQNRYKSNPQMMQQKMAEFYREHSFNPFSGCFPLLIQMPVFILLYTALMSPQFIQIAGESSFLFINRLDAPLRSHAGIKDDGKFGVTERDTFTVGKTATVYFEDNSSQEVHITDYKQALSLQGTIIPGQPIDFKMNLYDLQLSVQKLEQDFQKAEISVINNSTKEIETLDFRKKDSLLFAQAQSEEAKTLFHYDVLVLILLFGVTMYLTQKVMTATSKNSVTDPQQKAMQESMAKIMPFMITGMFIFFPIPAGVLLYMIVSNAIQVLQSVSANKIIEKEEQAEKPEVIEVEAQEPQNESKPKGTFSGQKKKGKF